MNPQTLGYNPPMGSFLIALTSRLAEAVGPCSPKSRFKKKVQKRQIFQKRLKISQRLIQYDCDFLLKSDKKYTSKK
jgi:hypothetical protein